MNLTDLLDLLGALLVVAGVGVGFYVLAGLWAGLVTAGLLLLALSYVVSRVSRGERK